jgi:LytS/YehU family sensor histidine kinase
MLGALYFANVLWLFPKLFNKKGIVIYVLTSVVAIYLLVAANQWVRKIAGVDQAYIDAWSTPGHTYVPDHDWNNKWAILLAAIFLSMSNLFASYRKLREGELAFEISEKERVSAELSFLKAQINPHFFFNTLHTVYSLTDTNPTAAKESIYTLSHLMRYVIYDTKQDFTILSKEIGFIEDYIKLMKVRVPANTQVIFDKQEKLRDVKIAPMLLLPFVENAFKHGIRAAKPSYIYISVDQTATELTLEVKNILFKDNVRSVDEKSGIGIENTRRRLDLLYPDKYKLKIEKDEMDEEYLVTLTLITNDH